LANALGARFEQGGQRADLEGSISLLRQAVGLQPSASFDHCTSLAHLANELLIRFKQGGQESDINEAISLFRRALELQVPPHPDRSTTLDDLSSALSTRFELGGQQIDFDEAESLHQEALNDSVSFYRHALELHPPVDPKRTLLLANLANSLFTRFEEEGQKSDLEEAISFHRQVLGFQTWPNRHQTLRNLSNALLTRFEQEGQQTDLNEAISLARLGVNILPTPYHLLSVPDLDNLADTLLTRFTISGQRDDLCEAISLLRQTLELSPWLHPWRASALNNLANALVRQFKQGSEERDLDEAISLYRETVELQESNLDRSPFLTNLANTLLIRFEKGGQQTDLKEAISLHKQALELLPSSHSRRSTALIGLANALVTQFQQEGQRINLDESISLHRQGLELTLPTERLRSNSLNNLANSLSTRRFEHGGLRSDLDECISLHRHALELFPSPHPFRSGCLNNLADALFTRFEGGQQQDLDEAILLHREALDLRPSPHPARRTSYFALANIFIRAHSLTSSGETSEFLEQAMSSFSAATESPSQSPSHRLHIATHWIKRANEYDHICAINAYQSALQTLPQVAALSFDVHARLKELGIESDGLARDASSCAIRAGDFVKAIEFLEVGRSILWSQVLSLRSPFDALRQIAPELGARLQDIASALELSSHRNISIDISDKKKMLFVDQEASRINRLIEEWETGINTVRELEGFEDFLRPIPLSRLKKAASQHPVVILIPNDSGSHCLLLTSTSVHHLDLPGLPTSKLQDLVNLVQIAVSPLKRRRSSLGTIFVNLVDILPERRGMRVHDDEKRTSDEIFRSVLGILWDNVVRPVIEFLEIKKSSSRELPILQWCTTGIFSFLPIHAAGVYNDEGSTECASEYFITSYTPTIGALLAGIPTSSSESFKMMVAIQSAELPSTKKELDRIKRHVPSDALVVLGVPGAPAQVEVVASQLSGVSIVHFACHGKQDRVNPLDSGLRLSDGLLRVSRIMQEPMPNGSLAFLCACETGMGDENLPDEAMSLGASLLFSGFRRVVATMWEMMDEDGPSIADAFYEEIFRGVDGKPTLIPDTTKSARALHMAVQKLRSQKVSFDRWVPFIHMGQVGNPLPLV
ncbi:hypothetical protein GALMADRAFT_75010, partial [Galerina marginata CBS 339.88]